MMKPSEFKTSIQAESYDKKTTENDIKCYVAEKQMLHKLSKLSILNFDSNNWRLEWRLSQNFTCSSCLVSQKYDVK